jgi:hypothetical protein
MAEQGGRSQSQQAEFMLERSFDRQGLLAEALTLSYGAGTAGFLMMLGRLMQVASSPEALRSGKPFQYDWAKDPSSAALEVVIELVDALYVPPKQLTRSSKIRGLIAEMGRLVGYPRHAKRLRDEWLRGEIDTIRQLVGPSLARRLANVRPAIRRGGQAPATHAPTPSGQTTETTSKAIADAVLTLVNATPHTPTREEIAGVVLNHLKSQKEGGNG